MRLDKAPDAFRTISEVAEDLDIPQHVLRFWETRFAQIKPMKRSGGRRYYRPDDVDLLRGIRRLLYGEGYTIRGVQRILKEQGVKAVQALASDGATLQPRTPAVPREPPADAPVFAHDDAELLIENQEPDETEFEDQEPEAPAPVLQERREPLVIRPAPPPFSPPPTVETAAAFDERRQRDHTQIAQVLQKLLDCRRILDQALESTSPATFEHLLKNPDEVKDKK